MAADASSLEEMEGRIARLEAELDRMKTAFRSHSLVSEMFALTDDQGRTRAMLGVADGVPGLHLLDMEGETRAMLALQSDGSPGLVFSEPGGLTRIVLSFSGDGGCHLSLSDGQERVRAVIAVQPDGAPAIGLLDADGNLEFKQP